MFPNLPSGLARAEGLARGILPPPHLPVPSWSHFKVTHYLLGYIRFPNCNFYNHDFPIILTSLLKSFSLLCWADGLVSCVTKEIWKQWERIFFWVPIPAPAYLPTPMLRLPSCSYGCLSTLPVKPTPHHRSFPSSRTLTLLKKKKKSNVSLLRLNQKEMFHIKHWRNYLKNTYPKG